MDAQGFLLWLDIFKAMAEKLVQEETSGGLGPTGYKDFSIEILHLHQPWTASMHMQMNRNKLTTTRKLRCICSLQNQGGKYLEYGRKGIHTWHNQSCQSYCTYWQAPTGTSGYSRWHWRTHHCNRMLWRKIENAHSNGCLRRNLHTIVASPQMLPKLHLVTLPTVQKDTSRVWLGWSVFGILMQKPHHWQHFQPSSRLQPERLLAYTQSPSP